MRYGHRDGPPPGSLRPENRHHHAADERSPLPDPPWPPPAPATSFPSAERCSVVLADDPCQTGFSGADPEYAGIYLHARYFDPQLGVFLSADPIGVDGGLNQYGYGFGDPINSADRSGLRISCWQITRDNGEKELICFEDVEVTADPRGSIGGDQDQCSGGRQGDCHDRDDRNPKNPKDPKDPRDPEDPNGDDDGSRPKTPVSCHTVLKARTEENFRLTHTGFVEGAMAAGSLFVVAKAGSVAARWSVGQQITGNIAARTGLSTLGQATETLLVGSANSTIAPGSSAALPMFAEGAAVVAMKTAVVTTGWVLGVGLGSLSEAVYHTATTSSCEW